MSIIPLFGEAPAPRRRSSRALFWAGAAFLAGAALGAPAVTEMSEFSGAPIWAMILAWTYLALKLAAVFAAIAALARAADADHERVAAPRAWRRAAHAFAAIAAIALIEPTIRAFIGSSTGHARVLLIRIEAPAILFALVALALLAAARLSADAAETRRELGSFV